jgi:hypothetical protein
MCFLRYPTSWHISKGSEAKDLILATFTRESGQHQCEVAVFCALLRRGFVLWCPLRFPHRNDVRFAFTSNCLCERSCIIYVICVCLRITVSNTYCAVLCFLFLRLVYHMLPVSLDCQFWLPLQYSLTFSKSSTRSLMSDDHYHVS